MSLRKVPYFEAARYIFPGSCCRPVHISHDPDVGEVTIQGFVGNCQPNCFFQANRRSSETIRCFHAFFQPKKWATVRTSKIVFNSSSHLGFIFKRRVSVIFVVVAVVAIIRLFETQTHSKTGVKIFKVSVFDCLLFVVKNFNAT